MPDPRYAIIVLKMRLGAPSMTGEGPVATPDNVKLKFRRIIESYVRRGDEPSWTRTPISIRVVLFDSSGRPIEQGT